MKVSDGRLLAIALLWAVRWFGRVTVSSLFAGLLLAPAATLYLFLAGIVEPHGLTQLDPLPWELLLWFTCVATYVLALLALWFALRFVWQRELAGIGISALVFAVPSCIMGTTTTVTLVERLIARQIQTTSEHVSLVLANYTTRSRGKGVTRFVPWVDLTHPMQPTQRLALSADLMPAGLRTPGQVVCLTVHTSLLGMRWLALPHSCPVDPDSMSLASFRLVLLQPALRDPGPEQRIGTAPPEGFFDDFGRAWWINRAGLRPTLTLAEGETALPRPNRCELFGHVRLSADRRSILSFANRSALGDPEPAPLPHWDQLGRNVWIQALDADGQCITRGALLQPGWVLDVDFEHASQRLAVLSARRVGAPNPQSGSKTPLEYRVTVYKVGADGTSGAVHEQTLGTQPHTHLSWRRDGLAVKHANSVLPARLMLPKVTPPAADTEQVIPLELPPKIVHLAPSSWWLEAEALKAPVSLYLHGDFGGALLFHRQHGLWYYLPPVLRSRLPRDPAADPVAQSDLFHFQQVRARLSPDGRRLIACGDRYIFTPTHRCVLLGLPWPG